jgi:hypothetical protein
VFTFPDSRPCLPFLRPDEPVPFFKIIKNLIGQDLTKVSLPVILNEPLCALQRFGEVMCSGHDLFERASHEEDPVKRLCLTITAIVAGFSTMKVRRRKPFNPMLGETYELVTENYRFVAEKVSHEPKQVFCYLLEGRDYKVWGY